jgi:hypothetical protein
VCNCKSGGERLVVFFIGANLPHVVYLDSTAFGCIFFSSFLFHGYSVLFIFIMADLDNFFAKKDKAKKKKGQVGSTGFSKANTDVIMKGIEENERRSEQKEKQEEKTFATSVAVKSQNAEDKATAEKAAEKDKDDKDVAAGGAGAGAGAGAGTAAATQTGAASGAGGGHGVSAIRAATSTPTGGYFGTTASASRASSEVVLATTDAARQAKKVFGISDDGTVKRKKKQKSNQRAQLNRVYSGSVFGTHPFGHYLLFNPRFIWLHCIRIICLFRSILDVAFISFHSICYSFRSLFCSFLGLFPHSRSLGLFPAGCIALFAVFSSTSFLHSRSHTVTIGPKTIHYVIYSHLPKTIHYVI